VGYGGCMGRVQAHTFHSGYAPSITVEVVV
jgi:hypothetical protein